MITVTSSNSQIVYTTTIYVNGYAYEYVQVINLKPNYLIK
nr:MAG TPA: hypothetical protein [Crassvirales sp.]